MASSRVLALLTLAACCLALLQACSPRSDSSTPQPAPAVAAAPDAAPPVVEPPAHAPAAAAERLLQGIDVSQHSGSVDWAQVAAEGHGFAILKATEGVDLPDAAYDDHWRGAAQAGLVRGAYHFYVTEDDPLQQAAFFVSRVHLQPGDLVPIIDIELVGHGTQDGWQQNLVVFAEALQQHYGVAPVIYTSPRFWSSHFQGEVAHRLAAFPLWIAEYDVEAPSIPDGWSTWHMWQYRGDAPIQGVEKGADLTRVNRQAADPAVLVVPAPAG